LEYVKDHRVKADLDDDSQHIINFLRMERWMTQADLHVVLVLDPAEAARREQGQRLIEAGGPTFDADLMEAMKGIYERRFGQDGGLQATKAKQCAHVGNASALMLDTTGLSPKRVAIEVINRAFVVLQAKIDAAREGYKEAFLAALRPLADMTDDFATVAYHVRRSAIAVALALPPERRREAIRNVKAYVEVHVADYSTPAPGQLIATAARLPAGKVNREVDGILSKLAPAS
jgi:hypothetical protein